MLLAISEVTAFSSTGRIPDAGARISWGTAKHPGSTSRKIASRRPCTTSYRLSNGLCTSRYSDLLSLDNKIHHDDADAMTRHSRPSSRRSASTRLFYRDGGVEDSTVDGHEHASSLKVEESEAMRWWQSVLKPAPTASPKDEEQQVVDEYLEFLNRRYQRLHANERRTPQPAQKFSALKWLTADKADPVTEQQQDDALYVLGVADLASERLLQKHQAAMQQQKKKPQQAVDTPAVNEPEDIIVIDAVVEEDTSHDVATTDGFPKQARQILLLSTFAQAFRSVAKGVGARRRALIAYQNRKLWSALAAAAKAAVSTPTKALVMLWHMGGGKRTIALTASAFFTVFMVIRPFAEAMLQDASLAA